MFSTYEWSRFFGRPFHLFIFRRQMITLRFASTGPGRNIVIGADTYYGAQIERSAIKQTVERAKDKITIKMPFLLDAAGALARGEALPITQPLGHWWRPHIPSDQIHVTCLAGHHGDPDPPEVEWLGWAVQPEFSDVELSLGCDPNPPHGEGRNQGPKWQKACWKTVHSTGIRGCNLDPAVSSVAATLGDVDGLTLTAPEFSAAPFPLAGGTLYWTRSDGLEEERPILSHSGTTIKILWGGAELEEGLNVVAEANCPGTFAACGARRPDPELHYGGALFKPVKDPTVGGSMSWQL